MASLYFYLRVLQRNIHSHSIKKKKNPSLFPRTGLILVPNGKLIGKQFGDRYPAEEALARHKLENRFDHGIKDEDWDKQGPGGRFYAKGQDDQETRILSKLPSKVRIYSRF